MTFDIRDFSGTPEFDGVIVIWTIRFYDFFGVAAFLREVEDKLQEREFNDRDF